MKPRLLHSFMDSLAYREIHVMTMFSPSIFSNSTHHRNNTIILIITRIFFLRDNIKQRRKLTNCTYLWVYAAGGPFDFGGANKVTEKNGL